MGVAIPSRLIPSSKAPIRMATAVTRRSVALLAFATLASSSPAQSSRTRLAVDHSGNDPVGNELAFALREAIRASSGYELVTQEKARFYVSLSTLDPDADRSASGAYTVLALVVTAKNGASLIARAPHTWYDIHLTSSVVVAGREKVDIMAKRIMASTEAAIERYRRDGGR